MPTYQTRANAQSNSIKIVSYYREQILAGLFKAGFKLPSEQELGVQYSISRGTVRQALNILEDEGLVEKVQGKGTFVRTRTLIEDNNYAARGVEKRIGLVFSAAPNEQFTSNILYGVEQTAKARGYQVNIAYCDEGEEQQAQDISRLLNDKIAGIIAMPVSDLTFDPTLAKLKQDGVPVVLVDRYLPDLDLDYVISDNFSGSYRVTEHLILQGYERIGFAHATKGGMLTTSIRDRIRGFNQAMENYDLPIDDSLSLHNGTWEKWRSLPDKTNVYDEFLLQPNRPEAIVANNDYVALSLMQAAKRCRIKIPEKLALVGFDDLPFAAVLNQPLTTVAQQIPELGVRATNLLINRIEGDGSPIHHIELLTSLIIRESCGAKMHLSRMRESHKAV